MKTYEVHGFINRHLSFVEYFEAESECRAKEIAFDKNQNKLGKIMDSTINAYEKE